MKDVIDRKSITLFRVDFYVKIMYSINIHEGHIRSKGGINFMVVFRVSAKSNPNDVAGAIATIIHKKGAVETQTIGAGALNQAVKALAIARGYMAPSGIDLICRPAFIDLEVDSQEYTAIRLMIEPKDPIH